MAVRYELWDLSSGNRLGEYESLSQALAEVHAGVAEDGPALWAAVGLLQRGDDGDETSNVAQGEALIAMVDPKLPSATVTQTA